MASNENPRQPLINPFASSDPSYVKYTEPMPSTTINMTTNSTSPIRSDQPSEKEQVEKKKSGLRQRLIEKKSSVKGMLMVNLSRRLASRKELHIRLSFLTDIMCFLAILGIILMIIENEITFIHINDRDTALSWFIKLTITISTIILVALLLAYHRLDLTLYSINNSIENWQFGLTNKKIFLIVLEVIICAIHPIPRSYPNQRYIMEEESGFNSTEPTPYPLTYISVDVALGLPMFARLYLLCRCILYHSHLIRDISFQSLGYLNQVSMDFFFLMKTYLEQWPTRSLLTFWAIMFFIGSWGLRACTYTPTDEHLSMLDAMWVFIVTATSVGYGDFTPTTYCGRTIAALVALFGLFSSALLIAVLSQKLVLYRWEKYVHTFVLNAELAKEHKDQAANVVKYAVKLLTLKKSQKLVSSVQYVQIQRKLFRSIINIQEIKGKQRVLIDNCIGPIELATIQRSTNTTINKTKQKITKLELKLDQMEEQLINVNNTVNTTHNTLNILVDKNMSSYF